MKQEETKEDGTFAGTLWSCVYNNTDRTLTLVCNRNYGTERRYSVDWEQE